MESDCAIHICTYILWASSRRVGAEGTLGSRVLVVGRIGEGLVHTGEGVRTVVGVVGHIAEAVHIEVRGEGDTQVEAWAAVPSQHQSMQAVAVVEILLVPAVVVEQCSELQRPQLEVIEP